MGLLVYEPYSKTIDPFCSRRATSYARNVPDPKTLRIMVYSCQSKNRLLCNASESVKKSKSCLKRAQAPKDGSLGELWTCLRVAPPPEALRRAGASAKAGPSLLESDSGEPTAVEPHGPKPVVTPHATEGGTLRSKPYYAPSELRRVPSSRSSTV